MRYQHLIAVAAVVTGAAAQTVVGKAYGMASGVTGGGSAPAVTPTTNDELRMYMSDKEARVIVLNKEFDFTGAKKSGAGCERKECNVAKGGQLFLGELSCSGSDVTATTVSYNEGSDKPLNLKGDKTLLGVGGKGVIKGVGINFEKAAKNIIIQGITMTNLNPGVVWGGDALFLQNNQGVWIDHCKFSLVGRMFVVSAYGASRFTLSNNEFDGVTTTSATCNKQHYWTMMFTDDGDLVSLDRNYFHNLSGRAPKLGAASCHATNNYFENMDGHAFDANEGVNAIIEGNVFKGVKQPSSAEAAKSSGFFTVANGGAACQSALGRACQANSVDSTSGKLSGGEAISALTFWGKEKANIVAPRAASSVAADVLANAGPSKLGVSSSGTSGGSAPAPAPAAAEPAAAVSAPAAAPAKPAVSAPAAAPAKPAVSAPAAAAPKPAVSSPAAAGSGSGNAASPPKAPAAASPSTAPKPVTKPVCRRRVRKY